MGGKISKVGGDTLRSGPEKKAALGYPTAKIYLKEDVVPTLFSIVEAMLTSSIRKTQAAIGASTTTVHLGLKRALSELSDRTHFDVGAR